MVLPSRDQRCHPLRTVRKPVWAAGAPVVSIYCAPVEVLDSGGIGAVLKADHHARDCSAFVLVTNIHIEPAGRRLGRLTHAGPL